MSAARLVQSLVSGQYSQDFKGKKFSECLLLNGVRGRQPVDKEALVEILLGVSQLAVEAGEDLLSLDINPVTVLPQGQGAKILDGVLVSSGLERN